MHISTMARHIHTQHVVHDLPTSNTEDATKMEKYNKSTNTIKGIDKHWRPRSRIV